MTKNTAVGSPRQIGSTAHEAAREAQTPATSKQRATKGQPAAKDGPVAPSDRLVKGTEASKGRAAHSVPASAGELLKGLQAPERYTARKLEGQGWRGVEMVPKEDDAPVEGARDASRSAATHLMVAQAGNPFFINIIMDPLGPGEAGKFAAETLKKLGAQQKHGHDYLMGLPSWLKSDQGFAKAFVESLRPEKVSQRLSDALLSGWGVDRQEAETYMRFAVSILSSNAALSQSERQTLEERFGRLALRADVSFLACLAMDLEPQQISSFPANVRVRIEQAREYREQHSQRLPQDASSQPSVHLMLAQHGKVDATARLLGNLSKSDAGAMVAQTLEELGPREDYGRYYLRNLPTELVSDPQFAKSFCDTLEEASAIEALDKALLARYLVKAGDREAYVRIGLSLLAAGAIEKGSDVALLERSIRDQVARLPRESAMGALEAAAEQQLPLALELQREL